MMEMSTEIELSDEASYHSSNGNCSAKKQLRFIDKLRSRVISSRSPSPLSSQLSLSPLTSSHKQLFSPQLSSTSSLLSSPSSLLSSSSSSFSSSPWWSSSNASPSLSSTSIKSSCTSPPKLSPIRVMLTAMVLLFICVHFSQGELVTLSPLPRKAPSVSGKETLLIILPEVGVPHTDYKAFGRIIQQLYPIRLWVELVDVPKTGELTLDILPLILIEINRRLKKSFNTRQTPDVFLAAHGHQGHLAADYARAVPHSLRGLILLGAFLPKGFTVASFPLPVMTVSGEIDGVTRITRVAEAFGRMMSDASFEPSLVTQSPFVLLEGCNHELYISGQLPASLYQMDIEAEREKSSAMEMAANMTSLFLVHTLQESLPIVSEAAAIFRNSFEKTKELTEPIRELQEMTQDADYKSYWVKAAQKWLSGLEGQDSSFLEVDSYIVEETGILALPPALVVEEGIPYVVTFSDVVAGHKKEAMGESMAGEDSGVLPCAPIEIAARMLGPERIQKFLQNTSISRNYTCRDLNYGSFMTAYHRASSSARQRYDSYHRGIIFEPDIITDSEALWESTRLKIEVKDEMIHVTSIAYKTPQDVALTEFSGLFFCKLLPPDRALEWIYVDSLRRSLPLEL